MNSSLFGLVERFLIYFHFISIKVYALFFKQRTVTLENKIKLIAPANNRLDFYLKIHPLYDRRLPVLSRLVYEEEPHSEFIDVGANIGDTVALLRLAGCDLKIVAIEASEKYFSYLKLNSEKDSSVFKNVELVNAFVGRETDNLSLVENNATAGTVISEKTNKSVDVPTIPLSKFESRNVSLIKLDTDGYDAVILSSNLDYIIQKQPIIFAEAEVNSEFSLNEWTKFLNTIPDDVFEKVIVFDNFGFAVCAGDFQKLKSFILDLLPYVHQQHKTKKPTIYYFDICFFPKSKNKIYTKFIKEIPELSQLK